LYFLVLASPSLAPLRGLSGQQVIQLEHARQQLVLRKGKHEMNWWRQTIRNGTDRKAGERLVECVGGLVERNAEENYTERTDRTDCNEGTKEGVKRKIQ
jgi:hypothetical protein